MRQRLATICLTTVLLIGGGSPSALAHGTDNATPTLKGISAVSVRVGHLSEGAGALGLTKEMIQTDVELKLRLAGMRVVTQEEDSELPGRPFLHLRVHVADSAKAAHIEVALTQNAQLERDGQRAFSVTTWRKGALIASPTLQTIRDEIKDKIDVFLNAWLSVNPKK